MNHFSLQKISSLGFLLALMQASTISGAALKSKPLPKDSATKPIVLPSRNQELPIPADGNCLYNSIMIGYLLPAVADEELFTKRLQKLVGKDEVAVSKKQDEESKEDNDEEEEKEDDEERWEVPKLLKDFRDLRRTNLVTALWDDPFAQIITDMKLHMDIRNRGWGGTPEMKTIAEKLQVTIERYIPDPKNKKVLTHLDTIASPKAKPIHTLRIVRDNPTQKAQHQDHYCALLDEIPIFVKGSEKSDASSIKGVVTTQLKPWTENCDPQDYDYLNFSLPFGKNSAKWANEGLESFVKGRSQG